MIQSYIVVSQSPQEIEQYIQQLLKTYAIDPLDQLVVELSGSSLGVKEMKTLQKDISITPFKGKYRLVVIPSAELLTIPAQNMLLKTLEEPPPSTIIVLVSKTKEAFLSTILSRCTLIELDSQGEFSENEEILKILNDFHSYSYGDRLRLAQDVSKQKEEALEWITDAIISLRKKMLEEIKTNNAEEIVLKTNVLSQLQKSHTTIKTTNINLRLHIETLFLSL